MKTTKDLGNMDYRYIVQIHNLLEGEWYDVAMFKEKRHADDFIRVQFFKSVKVLEDIEQSINHVNEIWRIIEKDD